MSDNSDNDDDASSGSEAIEWNVTQRTRRSTAGNRLSTLLGQEGATDDDEVQLLFQEDGSEPDEEFEGKDSDNDDENAAGGDSSSSSSDSDDDPNDELEGERQLQREERAHKKQQKRKTEQAFMKPRASKPKRVKIAEPEDGGDAAVDSPTTPGGGDVETQSTAQQLRNKKKKKSERVSWLLNTGDHGPVRTSSRTLSMQNKERTQASLKESEAKRKRQIAVMEAAQKRRDAEKTRPMTQEERLAEAAQTEKLNSKSLNRWEAMERDRLERQRAKLEALQNRRLEGPFVRWVSSRAEWQGDRLVFVGRRPEVEEIEEDEHVEEDEPSSKLLENSAERATATDQNGGESTVTAPGASMSEALHSTQHADGEQLSAEADVAGSAAVATEAAIEDARNPPEDAMQVDSAPASVTETSRDHTTGGRQEEPHEAPEVNEKPGPPSSDRGQEETEFLSGINEYAAMHDSSQDIPVQPQQSTAANEASQPVTNAPAPAPEGTSAPAAAAHPPAQPDVPPTLAPVKHESEKQAEAPVPEPEPVETTFASQQRITLVNFSESAYSMDAHRRVLFNWRPWQLNRPVKHAPQLCAVTSLPAKYRDPVTGIAYRDMGALKRVRRIVEPDVARKPVWSQALGAWIGVADAATGVPPGFIGQWEGVAVAESETAPAAQEQAKGEVEAAK